MAPQSDSLVLEQRIRQELASVEARAAELKIALRVLEEFGHEEVEVDVDVEVEKPSEGAAKRRIILKPSDDVPEAVKSRLAERTAAGTDLADRSLELDKN